VLTRAYIAALTIGVTPDAQCAAAATTSGVPRRADSGDTAASRGDLRQLVDEIRLTPRDRALAIDVKGNLAAMLTAAIPQLWRPAA